MWALSVIRARYEPSMELLKAVDNKNAPCLWIVRESSSCNEGSNQQCWIVTCQAKVKDGMNVRELRGDWLVNGQAHTAIPLEPDTKSLFQQCSQKTGCNF
jgi:hypothetical protein